MTVFTIPNYGEVTAGFIWEPWGRPVVPNFKEIKLYVEARDREIYCQYHATSRTSIGVLDHNDDDYRHPSLACLMAESIRENWIGIFQIGQMFWIGAANNAHPYPLTDKVFYDVEVAHKHLVAVLNLGEFNRLFLPHGYAATEDILLLFEGPIERTTIEKIIDQDAPQVYPRALHQSLSERFSEAAIWMKSNGRKALTFGFVGISAVSLMSFAYFSYLAPGTLGLDVDDAALQAQREKSESQKREKSWAEFRVKWESLPSVRDYYNACSGNLLVAMQSFGAWKADRFVCGDNGISIVYRGGGNPKDLQPLEAQGFTLRFDSTEQYRAQINFNLPARSRNKELIGLQDALEPLAVQREKLFKTMQKGGDTDLGIPRGLSREDVPNRYLQTSVTILGAYDPDRVIELLEQIPGFAITSATFDPSTYEWDFAGVLYHVQ